MKNRVSSYGGYTAIGLDFGTREARAQLRGLDGKLLGEAVFSYPHGVMSDRLPDGTTLRPGDALQHPQDYIDALHTLIPALLQSGDPNRVVGVGVDFTQCTMMPVGEDGAPLCQTEQFANQPMAYAKLWRHHSAQPQADRMTQVAQQRGEMFLAYCGESVYAESMFPKILETFERAPKLYQAADAFVELADWIPWYLTGERRRSRSIAGCAALWDPTAEYPSFDYLESVAPGFGSALDKLRGPLVAVGRSIGGLLPERAAQLGLPAGIPVAAGLGDCQAAFLGVGLYQPGVLLSVMGTSSCDMVIHSERIAIPGMYGISSDSMIPGYYGYEAGQATMGDLFRWLSEQWVPKEIEDAAKVRGETVFDFLNHRIAARQPAASGLLALDWWCGNRTVLLDTDLSGLLVGMTMNTTCEDVYQALMQSLAFGKRRIVEQFQNYGIPVARMRVTGGVAEKNPVLMQVFADVLKMPVEVSDEANGSCNGSCIYGALAGSGFPNMELAAAAMGGGVSRVYYPTPDRGRMYDRLYELYCQLHDAFGTETSIMKQLKAMQAEEGKK